MGPVFLTSARIEEVVDFAVLGTDQQVGSAVPVQIGHARRRVDVQHVYSFLPINPYWTTIAVNGVLWPVGYLLGFLWPNRRDLSGLTVWTGQQPA